LLKLSGMNARILVDVSGYSKLLVGLGQTASGLSADVEIVDLDMSSTSCKKFQEYPLRLEGAIGGLSFDETLRSQFHMKERL
jgi:hypothetical protein